MNRTLLALALVLSACAVEPEPKPEPEGCELAKGEDPTLEVSHYSTFDNLGPTLYCGIPPQGGAPYAPFGVRFRGVTPEDNGAVVVSISAADPLSGELLGDDDFFERFLCSNVGESEGYWVAAEFHLRFYDYSLDDLHGREVAVHFVAEGVDGTIEHTLPFTMDCLPGTTL